MAGHWMKRVRFTSYPVGNGWGYVIHVDKNEVKTEEGFLTQKDADAAGYKEKQRLVIKLQQGKFANCLLEFAVLLMIAGLIFFLFFNGFGIGG